MAAIGEFACAGKRGGNCKRKMSLSILDIAHVLAGGPDQQIDWFQQKGLIARNKACPSCGLQMRIQSRNDIQDKKRYRHMNITVLLDFTTIGGAVLMTVAKRAVALEQAASLISQSCHCSSGLLSFSGGCDSILFPRWQTRRKSVNPLQSSPTNISETYVAGDC